jgi:hypothetical protein
MGRPASICNEHRPDIANLPIKTLHKGIFPQLNNYDLYSYLVNKTAG